GSPGPGPQPSPRWGPRTRAGSAAVPAHRPRARRPVARSPRSRSSPGPGEGRDGDTLGLEEGAGRACHVDRSLRVAVEADRLRVDVDEAAVDRLDLTGRDEAQHPCGHGVRVTEDRVRLRPGDQGAVGIVGAVGEGLGGHIQPRLGGDAVGDAAGQTEGDERVVDGSDGGDDDLRLRLIADDRIVETAVGLDVGDFAADARGQSDQRPDLVFDLGLQGRCRNVEGAPAEAFVVVVSRVGADDDTALDGGIDGGVDALGVAGMEPAGDVGAGDQAEHGRIVADDTVRDVLSEVRVEVDSGFAVGRHCHPPTPIIAKMGPMDCTAVYHVTSVAAVPMMSNHFGEESVRSSCGRNQPMYMKIVRPMGRMSPLKPPTKTSSVAGAVPTARKTMRETTMKATVASCSGQPASSRREKAERKVAEVYAAPMTELSAAAQKIAPKMRIPASPSTAAK